ncbi:MAG: hypothetical protein ACTSYX_05790 [Candidatus Thorarchaeota archaeon]
MAEQFLSRLAEIEKKVEGLGETLRRMVTILTTVTEIKSEMAVMRDQILSAIGTSEGSAPEVKLSEELAQLVVAEVRAAKDEILSAISSGQVSGGTTGPGTDTEQLAEMIKTEMGFLGKFLGERIEAFKEEVLQTIQSSQPVAPAAPPTVDVGASAQAPPPPPAHAPPPPPAGSHLPLEKGMKVAEQLERIIKAMKMGCVAGDVLEVMTDAKAEIMKITSSDPIMVKIDKWASVVAAYSKRHELQARDILKLKKEIREEIPKYRPP